jgi:penicillin-binding protein 1A
VTNLRAGEVEQGGSTITQQYVKNAVVGSERTYMRKIKEAALAIKVDRQYDKDTVLSWYLNTIYWGRGAQGIGAASQTYYDVPAPEIDLNQAATLAGIIQSPETARSRRRTADGATTRRYVLDGMLEEGWITQAEHDDVVTAPLPEVTDNTALSTQTAPYYMDAVRRELRAASWVTARSPVACASTPAWTWTPSTSRSVRFGRSWPTTAWTPTT